MTGRAQEEVQQHIFGEMFLTRTYEDEAGNDEGQVYNVTLLNPQDKERAIALLRDSGVVVDHPNYQQSAWGHLTVEMLGQEDYARLAIPGLSLAIKVLGEN